MFDRVDVSNSDLSASERFYRTVLSVLGVEPSYADADMVAWDDRVDVANDRRALEAGRELVHRDTGLEAVGGR